jgi:DNA repair exonuclease SbcCD nuclease subunit
MSVRLLHTSDVHLGATFRQLGDRGREQRRQIEATFGRAVDLAIEERVDLFLIAGDLFDSIAAARARATFAARELRRLGDAGVPVCIAAGNHDPLGEGSASMWQDLAVCSPLVTVLGLAPDVHVFPELDLAVAGRSRQPHLSAESPFADLPLPRRTRFLVALAHGSLQRPDLPAQFGSVTPDEIAASGADYLALGDWHSTRDVSSGSVTAWYCGSPEMIDFDEPDSGNVCLVTLHAPGRVEVVPRRIGRRRGRRLVLDVAACGGPESIGRAIRAQADPDLALTVTLAGLAPLEGRVRADQLQEDLAGEFFWLRIRDESHIRPEVLDAAQFPESTVLGCFARLMQEEVGRREGDARSVAEDALHLGVALLEGKEILG